MEIWLIDVAAERILRVIRGHEREVTSVAWSAPAPTTDSRPQWLAAQDALRDYVRKVSSYADPEVPGSEALAAWLLAPFTDMVAAFAARPQPKKKPAPPPGDEKPR